MNYTLNVTSQGQVSIPAKVRRLWGLIDRGQITLTLHGQNAIVAPVPDLLSLGGSLHKYAIKGKSIEEIKKLERKGVEDAVVERYFRKEKSSGNKLLAIKAW